MVGVGVVVGVVVVFGVAVDADRVKGDGLVSESGEDSATEDDRAADSNAD